MATAIDLGQEILDFVASLGGSEITPMSVNQLEISGHIQRSMLNIEKNQKKSWGSKKNIFEMGKKIGELEWFPMPKRIYSANSQIQSWFGYNVIREDRRVPWVATARKKLVPKKISLFDLEKMLAKNPQRKYEVKEVYALSFDVDAIEDMDVRTFIDDVTLFGGKEGVENYEIFVEKGTDNHREIVKKYGQIKTYYEHYIDAFEMEHYFQTYAKSIKYTTKKYKGMKSIYLGTACSINRSRKTEYILEISHCFTELDHYKIEKYKHLTAKELYPLVLERLSKEGFPMPTDVTFSRGLQLVWKISPIGSYKRSSWIIVQRKIHSILEEFGADAAVISDAVRLLRLVGTIHEKTGEKITALCYTNDRYDFENLMQTTCPKEYDDLLKRREFAVNKQQKMLEKGFTVLEGKKSLVPVLDAKEEKGYTLSAEHRKFNIIHGKRLFDLMLLISIRKGEMTGIREVACFLTRYWYLCMTGCPIRAINKMKDVFYSMEMYGTYDFDEMIVLTKSAEKAWENWTKNVKRGYNYSPKRLVELLEITPEEAKQMKHIMTEEEAQRRKKERDSDKERNTARNRARGHKDREEEKQRKYEAVKAVLEANPRATNKDIFEVVSKDMKISPRTVDSYAKEARKTVI